MIIVLLVMVLFGGFRFNVGADWEPYLIDYNSIYSWDDVLNSRLEKLFCISILFSNKVKFSYLVFVPVFFFFSFFFKYRIFKSLSPNFFLSVLIYFYTVFLIYDINGIRQGMSLALTLYSIKYIESRRVWIFLLFCLLAIGFHYSAFFFIPAYWLYNFKFDITKIKAIITIIVVIIVAIPIRIVVQGYTSSYLEAEQMLSHYSAYMGSDYNVGSSIITAGTIQRIAIFLIYVFSLGISKNRNSIFELFLSKAYFLGIIIFVFFSFSMEYAARLSFCYKIMETLMIPIAIQKVSKRAKVIILSVVLFFAVFSIYQSLHLPNQGYLLPYHNQIINFLF